VTLTDPEAGPVPAELVAVTEQLYATPFVSEPTETGLAEPDAVLVVWPVTVQVAV
jgi:hypothetical protein